MADVRSPCVSSSLYVLEKLSSCEPSSMPDWLSRPVEDSSMLPEDGPSAAAAGPAPRAGLAGAAVELALLNERKDADGPGRPLRLMPVAALTMPTAVNVRDTTMTSVAKPLTIKLRMGASEGTRVLLVS